VAALDRMHGPNTRPFIGPNRPADAHRGLKPAPERTLSDREALCDKGLKRSSGSFVSEPSGLSWQLIRR
jgi:hypothetical protein